ncbi:hypothetical protein Xmau_02010 [Xenorhabdus mauleonii]|uniref:Uncharacterized protein n=1 Tax=Xenorhabdus mauleonii TaxID=351675 RepID=A0A1I3HVX1_9GAMM|nr:hypothetical protein [Xenorhabdus mauleonii]PHM40254.1 hypothetical protein Xmau_02010 [Xenorhabdus mauleonii]SFI39812.1 hypothetical protein SAMN05421680_10187 [Xenorhabdus mauleonii]
MKIMFGSIMFFLFLFMKPVFAETAYNIEFVNSSNKHIYIDKDYDYCMNDAGDAHIIVPKNEGRKTVLKDSDSFANCRASSRYVNWTVRYPQGEDIVSCGLTFKVDGIFDGLIGAPLKWLIGVGGCNELVNDATCGEVGCHNKLIDYYSMKDKNMKIIFK